MEESSEKTYQSNTDSPGLSDSSQPQGLMKHLTLPGEDTRKLSWFDWVDPFFLPDFEMLLLLEENRDLENVMMHLQAMILSENGEFQKSLVEKARNKFKNLTLSVDTIIQRPSISDCDRQQLEIFKQKLHKLDFLIKIVCQQYNYTEERSEMKYIKRRLNDTLTNGYYLNQAFPASSNQQIIQMNQMLGQSIYNKPYFGVRETQEKEGKEHQELQSVKVPFGHSLSPDHVINIGGKNEATELVNNWHTFVEFCSRGIMHSSPELRGTLLATLYGVQLGQLWALGNPFDILSQSTTTSKDTHTSLLSLGQAFSISLPAMIWSAMFLLNFAYTTILAWSLPFRVPISSLLLISLAYYFSATSKMLAFSVLWGSVKMPGPLFAFGGAFGFVLLTGILIFGALCISWRYFPNLEK